MPEPLKVRHFSGVAVEFLRGSEKAEFDPERIVTQYFEVGVGGEHDRLLFEVDPLAQMLLEDDGDDEVGEPEDAEGADGEG